MEYKSQKQKETQAAASEAAWKERAAAAAKAFSAGRYSVAATEYEFALREAEVFGSKDARLAATLNNLAGAYAAQGRSHEAEQMYGLALELREAIAGPASPQLAQTLNNLAALYASRRKFEDAEKAYRRALEITESSAREENLPLAATLNNLALLYKNQGRFEEALLLFQRALRIGLKVLGAAHPFIATGMNNFGAICVAQEKHAEGEAFFKQALAIKEKALGPRHPEVATILNNIADLYCVSGRRLEAKPLYERILGIDEETLGPSHSEVAADLAQLGSVCQAQGDNAEAGRHYRRALDIRESIFGHGHPLVAQIQDKLNALSQDLGQAAPVPASTSEPVKAEAPAGLLLATGAEPGLTRPAAAQSLSELADRCVHDARWLDAEKLYRRELEIEQSVAGPDAACTGATLNNCGCAVKAQGNRTGSALLFQASLSVWLNSKAGMASIAAMALNNLAALSAESGRYSQAESFYRQSAEMRKGLSEDLRNNTQPWLAIAANLASLRDSHGG